MPRGRRLLIDGYSYHVLNRGNRRQAIFKKEADYEAFLTILGECSAKFGIRPVSLCVMPNHWLIVLRPERARAIPAYMHWLSTAHVHRYHLHYGLTGTGHLYQGRYRLFPVQNGPHLLTVLRYVEANALRAGMVRAAEDWPWSGLALRQNGGLDVLDACAVQLPVDWRDWVNSAMSIQELQELRKSARQGDPYGDQAWIEEVRRK
jgi:putative transposase